MVQDEIVNNVYRNHTGIKHWKLSTKSGKFYWGTSLLHSSLDSFVQVCEQAEQLQDMEISSIAKVKSNLYSVLS